METSTLNMTHFRVYSICRSVINIIKIDRIQKNEINETTVKSSNKLYNT